MQPTVPWISRGAGRGRPFPAYLLLVVMASGCAPGTEQRRASVFALGSAPDERHVEDLRELLRDSDRDVRATALTVVVGLGVPDARELALVALSDPDSLVRACGAKLLGDLGDPSSAEPVAAALVGDEFAAVRERAAETLAKLGGEVAAEALVQALVDPVARVRAAAVMGLAGIDPGRSVEQLRQILAEDPSWEVRVQAAHALGQVSDPSGRSVLEQALLDPNEFVRAAASDALLPGLRPR